KFYQDIGVTYTTSFQNQIHAGDSNFFTPATLDAMQYGMNHRAGVSGNFKLFKYLAFSPGVNYTDYWYFQSIRKSYDAAEGQIKTDTVPGFTRGYDYNFSASLSTILYGMFNFKKGKVKAVRHVMTPGVSFTYRPDFGEDHFGFY